MTLLLNNSDFFIWGMEHRLGGVRRDLDELKEAGLICNEATELGALGYEHNYGISPEEDLYSLAAAPMTALLEKNPKPEALIVHHAYAQNTSVKPGADADPGFMPHAQYFPAALMRNLNIADTPYLGSFASGCTGLMSLMMTGSGFASYSTGGPAICLTADIKPVEATYDSFREKILTSDCSSGFFLGRERCGYKVLGLSYYSTRKMRILLIDIVKRAVQMVRDLIKALDIEWPREAALFHYPNAFPQAWQMVSDYLKAPAETIRLDGLADRAHCLSSDSVITLGKSHRGETGRLHIVVNFGAGYHLGVCILREEARRGPEIA